MLSKKHEILIVDDEPNILSAYSRHLRKKYNVSTASGAEEALKIANDHAGFTVIVSDMTMPGIDGVTLLKEFKEKFPDTVRLMLTGNADQKTASQAINTGEVFRFLNKPCKPDDLAEGIEQAIKHYELIALEKELLEKTLAGSVKVLVDVLSIVHKDGFGKTQDIRKWVALINGEQSVQRSWELSLASMLYPLTEISVPQEVRKKQKDGDVLTESELVFIEQAPDTIKSLLKSIPRLEQIAEIIYYQDKNYDGTGYPTDGVKGKNIPYGARLIRILKDLRDIMAGTSPTSTDFDMLFSRSGNYDVELIAETKSILLNKLSREVDVANGSTILRIPVSMLKPGDVLVDNLYLETGELALAKGQKLLENQIPRISLMAENHKFIEPIRVMRAG